MKTKNKQPFDSAQGRQILEKREEIEKSPEESRQGGTYGVNFWTYYGDRK